MSTKPIHLGMQGDKGMRQRAWEELRLRTLHGEAISMPELAAIIDVETLDLRDYISGLIAAGYIAKVRAPKRGIPAAYKVVRDNGAEAPRVKRDGSPLVKGMAEEQMWRILRSPAGADITALQLAAYASTPTLTVSELEAQTYLGQLAGAKYIAPLSRRGASQRWRLVSNTGPKPPMFARIDSLYDPNLSTLIWVQPVTEETCLYGN